MKTKEWLKRRFAKQPLGRCIFALVMLFVLFLKLINFYSVTKMGIHSIALACTTVIIVAAIHFIILIFFPKAANVTLTVIFFLLSIVMCADMIYFGDRNRLISAAIIKMAGQLTHVTGSIEQLITFRNILPLLDLPIWIVVLATGKFGARYRRMPVRGWIQPFACGVFAAVLCLTLVGSILFGSFKFAFFPNELLIYHTNDIYKAFFAGGESADQGNYIHTTDPDNPYFGIAKDRNVFVIQVEALQDFVIGEEHKGDVITPFMNSLIENDSLYFENYYYQIGGGNTSDAEFIVNNSLYPRDDAASYVEYPDNDYYGLPWLLKDRGYTTAAFHGYEATFWNREAAYVKQGFDDFISIEDFKAREDFKPGEMWSMDGGGLSDRGMFNQTVNIVSEYEEPFYSFIITLSSHSPFSIPLADRRVDAANMSPNLYTLYLQSISYFDRTLEEFFSALDAKGLYENSIFVIYGDHFAMSNTDADIKAAVEETIGRPYDMFDRYGVPLIIHIPGLGKAETFDTVGGHVDVLPTLLCLLGIENDKSVIFGHNLLEKGYEGIAYQLTHLQTGSFFTKDAMYMYTTGGINSAVYNRDGTLGDTQNAEYLQIVEKAKKAISDSKAILDNNDVLIK